MRAFRSGRRPFDAVLCDLDNVIRFYDTARLAELERASGLPEGTTMEVAFAPEVDLPLLLGRITTDEWVEAIAHGLTGRGTDRGTDRGADRGTGAAEGPADGRVMGERARELGRALARAPFRADAEVVALLRRARAHVPLVLVTNASSQLDQDLASLGLSDLADQVVSSAVEGVAKPDRAIYEIAAARAGVPKERCLFVDDRRENVEAAVALGMTGALFREPADLERALRPVLTGGTGRAGPGQGGKHEPRGAVRLTYRGADPLTR
ncbi:MULTISPECIES: HAD family hydrolase [unclassified Streptomyces]|uniref:HAD family hydrolase n=1 Tax=Streptomyces sp. NPDC055082 TaxID=3365718 RepID=UPI0037D06340